MGRTELRVLLGISLEVDSQEWPAVLNMIQKGRIDFSGAVTLNTLLFFLQIHSDEKYTCNPCGLSNKHRITSLCPEYLQGCLQPDILQLFAFIPEQYSIFTRFCMQFKGPNLSS